MGYLDGIAKQEFKAGNIIKLQVAKVEMKGVVLFTEDEREIFMPLREIVDGTPPKYSYVWVGIIPNRDGKLVATQRIGRVATTYSQPAIDMVRGSKVTGQVYNLNEAGAFIRTGEGYIGHIPQSDIQEDLAVGMMVEGRVTFVREDGRFNFSLRPVKEVALVVDAEKILEYLRNRRGEMPYTDESTPEIIMEKFGISKKAFKRAMGNLMKEGLVEQEGGWTRLIKREK